MIYVWIVLIIVIIIANFSFILN